MSKYEADLEADGSDVGEGVKGEVREVRAALEREEPRVGEPCRKSCQCLSCPHFSS